MITVIIAGGSGTRLWPLSTPAYPKHLLKINGDDRSLLQNTYDRAKRISEATYVITEVGHAHHLKEQLPELADENFVIEPARRGTASCIVAALAHITDKHDADEPIVVLSADHFMVCAGHSWPEHERGHGVSSGPFLIDAQISQNRGDSEKFIAADWVRGTATVP